jgi:hypothetical protein
VGGKDYDLSRLADPVADLFLHGASAASEPTPAALAAAERAAGGR